MRPKPQPRRVQLIHKAIAINAAAGDMQAAHQAWEMAPKRYQAVMSLCMWVGRFRKRAEG